MHPGYQQPTPVENNMGMAVVALLVFWPLGLIAVINSSKINGLLQVGDHNGAHRALAESRKWTKYAFITAAIWYGVVLVCCLGWAAIGGGAALFGNTSA